MKKCLFCLWMAATAFSAETRSWTDAQGNQTQAVLRGFDGGDVLLQNAAGKTLRVPVKNLSEDDQRYVVLNISTLIDASATPLSTVPVPASVPVMAKATWPATLTAPDGLTNADYVELQSKPGRHLYRSRRFEYVLHAYDKLTPTVMKDVARVFEGTYELLSQSPFGVQASVQRSV